MKKFLSITAFAAAMIAASATSCQKEQFDNQNDKQQTQEQGLVFYATLENTDTKTTITNEDTAGYKISWENTDCISINGIEYVAVPDGENPAKATFNKKNAEDPDPEAPFTAYYPASIYDGTTATLPATQVYQADGSIAAILPMYATNETENTFMFKNLCGLFKFTLKGTEKVQNITVTDETKALSGKFTVTDNAAVLDDTAKGGVSLDCGAEGVLLDETTGKTFYVAVPAGSYANLHIEYNTVNYAKYAKMKANGTASVARNKVYPFTQTPKFKADWFYFEAVEAGATIAMSATGTAPTVSLQYSTDGGENWNDFTVGSTSVSLANVGDRVYFKATETNDGISSSYLNCNYFTTSANVNVGGNIMYLLNGSTPGLVLSNAYCFYILFDSTPIVSASELKLSATTLSASCYSRMFNGCTALVNAPALPATTLGACCYQYMFNGCTALVNAPALPATTLGDKIDMVYSNMFQGCTALVNAPALPATTLNRSCYSNMFNGCTKLVNAPALPAKTLNASCYSNMFNGCTALVEAPSLPAETLTDNCYNCMFKGCTALGNAPTLPAETLANYCYKSMFQDCTSLDKAPSLPAKTLVIYCYQSMFQGCTSLDKAPSLPATALKASCYQSMFQDCTSLDEAPSLPAETMANSCYQSMFQGCTALVKAPDLPATALIKKCYYSMFQGCSLISSVNIGATVVSGVTTPLKDWLKDTASSGTIHVKNSTVQSNEIWNSTDNKPEGWTVVTP